MYESGLQKETARFTIIEKKKRKMQDKINTLNMYSFLFSSSVFNLGDKKKVSSLVTDPSMIFRNDFTNFINNLVVYSSPDHGEPAVISLPIRRARAEISLNFFSERIFSMSLFIYYSRRISLEIRDLLLLFLK